MAVSSSAVLARIANIVIWTGSASPTNSAKRCAAAAVTGNAIMDVVLGVLGLVEHGRLGVISEVCDVGNVVITGDVGRRHGQGLLDG